MCLGAVALAQPALETFGGLAVVHGIALLVPISLRAGDGVQFSLLGFEKDFSLFCCDGHWFPPVLAARPDGRPDGRSHENCLQYMGHGFRCKVIFHVLPARSISVDPALSWRDAAFLFRRIEKRRKPCYDSHARSGRNRRLRTNSKKNGQLSMERSGALFYHCLENRRGRRPRRV